MQLKRHIPKPNEATAQMRVLDTEIDQAAQSLYRQAEALAIQLQAKYRVGKDHALGAIFMRLRDYDNGLFADGRAAIWRGRLRIYLHEHDADAIYDSDADLDPRAPSATAHVTLPVLMQWALDHIATYHAGRLPIGLDRPTLERRLRSFRTQLSTRKDGTGILRLDYAIDTIGYLGRIDIVRQSQTAAVEAKSVGDRLAASVTRQLNNR
jgi:hypothetical protein